MKNFSWSNQESTPHLSKIVKIISIRIIPSSGSSNFTRNPAFAHAFSLAFIRFVQLCEKMKGLRVQQIFNHVILTFDAENPAPEFSLKLLASTIVDLMVSLNMHLKQHSYAFSLNYFLAADQGKTLLNPVLLNHPLYMDYIWLGEVLERAIRFSDIAGTGKYPDFLISHTLYEELDPELKNHFSKSYYYQHMCCYGSKLL